MKLRTAFLCILLVTGLAACVSPTATPVPAATPTLEVPENAGALAKQAAVEALAYNLSISEGDIEFISAEAVDWPDSCLGAGTGSMACAQVVTPGYKIILKANNKTYEYHTNLDGSSVMLASTY